MKSLKNIFILIFSFCIVFCSVIFTQPKYVDLGNVISIQSNRHDKICESDELKNIFVFEKDSYSLKLQVSCGKTNFDQFYCIKSLCLDSNSRQSIVSKNNFLLSYIILAKRKILLKNNIVARAP